MTDNPIVAPCLQFNVNHNVNDRAAIFVGGAPRLPVNLEWPRGSDGKPLHFLAEIVCSALPRTHEQAHRVFEMPTSPATGRLFIFLPLFSDSLWNEQVVVLYDAEEAEPSNGERDPPDDLPVLDEDYMPVDLSELEACGKLLNRRDYVVETYLSFKDTHPLQRNMERAASPEEEYERDLAYAARLKEYGIDLKVPLPTPNAAREEHFNSIPSDFQSPFEQGTFQWTWEYIFEFGKRALSSCYNRTACDIREAIHDDRVGLGMRRFLLKIERKKASIDEEKINSRTGLWKRISCDHPPAPSLFLDTQFMRWMEYARLCNKKGVPLVDSDKWAFVAMLQEIERAKRAGGSSNLRLLRRVRNHDVRAYDVHHLCIDVFRNIAVDCANLHPNRHTESQFDFGDASHDMQMFGFGTSLNWAVEENADKVLLLEVNEASAFNPFDIDILLQLWITHDDLAKGRFDRVISTVDGT